MSTPASPQTVHQALQLLAALGQVTATDLERWTERHTSFSTAGSTLHQCSQEQIDELTAAIAAEIANPTPIPPEDLPASGPDIEQAYELLAALGNDTANEVEQWIEANTDLSTVGSNVASLNQAQIATLLAALEQATNQEES